MSSALLERYDAVSLRLERAVASSGRPKGSVRLVAISKGHDADAIRALYEERAHRLFGESYAQELERKALALSALAELEWHFVGHLQTNKAKLVATHAQAVHALDNVRAVQALARAASRDRPIRAFISVNFGMDQKEHGAREGGIAEVRAAIVSEPTLRFQGYMTLPPDDEEATRDAFARLRRIRDDDDPALDLSMGMSHDLEEAVRLGATFVRIGTAIFGERSKPGGKALVAT